ncbi:uncharacterized protein M421DRAFT_3666 [Didymella exigua CBS 183.55]|uniref:Uncharacterized protein n=1 Tax=Didymella exigua CBS 183.55 TaxID=1150837 RepID=A0A6A5RTZ8_9PLEO|nr:uncharacterized protein M421DRAFT_3666 [Didymella exigua CBS 183.55]KAF1930634.1 hypothetical protein M421DRAFT_3666 [Didymella exigua CBS 183.55]
MPSYADDDLISLTDEYTVTSSVSSGGVATTSSSKIAANRCSLMKRDSFSYLTVMMKAKKPYTPALPPKPRVSLSVATSGVQFASRVSNESSILSPLARPYHADGSVAEYLQNQACSSTSAVTSPTTEYSQQNLQRLESMLKELGDIQVEDDEDDNATAQLIHSEFAIPPLPPRSEPLAALPVRTGPITPPTPAESTEPQNPEEPVVRVAMHTWDAMGRDVKALKDEKRTLELKIARLEKQRPPSRAYREEEFQAEIGHLKYQNEQNKTQKATMARNLSQKDVEIKQLQLDLGTTREALEAAESAAQTYANIAGERDYLHFQLSEDRISSERQLSNLAEVKTREIQALTRSERLQNNEHRALADTRLEAINTCVTQPNDLKEKYAAEHDRVNELEDTIEDLQGRLNRVSKLQAELSQKSSECDRWRTRYKNQEKLVETWKLQIERARNENESLRGAAHLVNPVPTSKLSPLVLGCTECYTKNISCDNKARCRNCTENNEKCSRWRCSLKHRLGQCPTVPCTFPHEEDGWLLAPEPRPYW